MVLHVPHHPVFHRHRPLDLELNEQRTANMLTRLLIASAFASLAMAEPLLATRDTPVRHETRGLGTYATFYNG